MRFLESKGETLRMVLTLNRHYVVDIFGILALLVYEDGQLPHCAEGGGNVLIILVFGVSILQ